jgi:mono/diheme cytochrome c family protein
MCTAISGCPKKVVETAGTAPATTASPPGQADPGTAHDTAAPADAAPKADEKTIPQPGPDPTENELAAAEADNSSKSGSELYTASNCALCHGADRNGSALGPPLRKLKANWTAEEMVKFFKDPSNYAANNPRLAADKGKYSVPMQPLRIADADQLRLAQWLLEQD